jgi:methionyl-tRNA formyltransferase
MSQSLKIVFFGNEHLATGVESQPLIFKALLDAGHQILALVVHSSLQTSRKIKQEPIVVAADENNIPVLNPAKTLDSIDILKSYNADCGVLVAYGKIIPQEVIDIFPRGIINLHPSLLPKLRGSTPIETVILEGIAETGVSIMKLVKKMDAGPVYRQATIEVSPLLSKQELADTLHKKGREQLLFVLDDLDNATGNLKAQHELEATFCTLISKTDGLINWADTAATIERKIRAYAGWPRSYFDYANKRYIVHKAGATTQPISSKVGTIATDIDSLTVQTTEGVIRITSIQPEGKKEMPIKAFLAGYRDKLS